MTAITTASKTTDVTRTLLGAGVIAGPLFVCTAAVQALTRDGFDLRRHPLSMLALGEYGWIQVINFIIAGVLSLIFAVGVARRLADRARQHVGTQAACSLRRGSGDRRRLQGRSGSRLSRWRAAGLSRAAQPARHDSCIRAADCLPVGDRGLLRDRPSVLRRGNATGGRAHSSAGSGVLRAQCACRTRSQRASLRCGGAGIRLDNRIRRVSAAWLRSSLELRASGNRVPPC